MVLVATLRVVEIAGFIRAFDRLQAPVFPDHWDCFLNGRSRQLLASQQVLSEVDRGRAGEKETDRNSFQTVF